VCKVPLISELLLALVVHVRLLFGLLLVELVLLPVQGLACLLLFTGSAWEGRAQDLLGLSVCKVLRQLLVHHSGLLASLVLLQSLVLSSQVLL